MEFPRLEQASQKYFNVGNELKNIRSNDWKTNLLAIGKLISFPTIIVPAFFWVFSKNPPSGQTTEKVDDMGSLLKPSKSNSDIPECDVLDNLTDNEIGFKPDNLFPDKLQQKVYIIAKTVTLIKNAKADPNLSDKEKITIAINLNKTSAGLEGKPDFQEIDSTIKDHYIAEGLREINNAASPTHRYDSSHEGNYAIITLTKKVP